MTGAVASERVSEALKGSLRMVGNHLKSAKAEGSLTATPVSYTHLDVYKRQGAWLSSARVVRCWVKSRNERNPYRPLLTRKGEDSDETAGDNSEEGGDDVKSSCPLRPGLHTCYNGYNKEKRDRKVEQNSEKYSQFRLWAATRPHEVGVASNRGSACRGEYVPGPCTHRPSHHGSR